MTLKEKFENVTDFIEWDIDEVNPQEQRVKIADDFAIDFAEWLRGDYYSFGDGWMPFGTLKKNNFTSKELLKIYKKEKEIMTVTDDELEILEENILKDSTERELSGKYIYLDDLATILSNFFKIKITL